MYTANVVNAGPGLWRLVGMRSEWVESQCFFHFQLANCRETVDAIARSDRYEGPEEISGMPVVLVDSIQSVGRTPGERVHVKRLRIVEPPPARALEVLPACLSARPNLVPELCSTVAGFRNAALRDFVGRVLTPEGTGVPFIRVPASTSFHHSYPSGLLVHSLDCAQRVIEIAGGVSQDERELAQVAALLHDIGKTRTYVPAGRRSALGLHVHHDALILELCADALRILDAEWPWAAIMLRRIWTWRVGAGADWKKQPAMAIALSCADRLSGEMDRREADDPDSARSREDRELERCDAHG